MLDRPLAAVTVVDMREEFAAAGPDLVLSRALAEALAVRLERREQALVLLNRRGFATAVFCRRCAGTMDCPNCSVSLVVHGEGVSAGHAATTATTPRAAAPACSVQDRISIRPASAPNAWRSRFAARVRAPGSPGSTAIAIRRKGSLTTLLAQFMAGEIDVLVGAQMIAKGHDFPRVTLVGVVSADVGLGMADFRASERTFQLLTQVVGRAGRGDQAGEAIVQTLYPHHYSVQLACRQDYSAFFDRELEFRRRMRYPPFVSMINAVVRSRTFAGAMDDAAGIAQRLRGDAERAGLRVLGPAPAPLGKLRGEYRAQLLIKGSHRNRMRGSSSRPWPVELQRRSDGRRRSSQRSVDRHLVSCHSEFKDAVIEE